MKRFWPMLFVVGNFATAIFAETATPAPTKTSNAVQQKLDIDDGYQFVSDYIDGLSLLQNGANRITGEKSTDPILTSINMKKAVSDYQEAIFLTDKYRNSHNRFIADGADSINKAYESLILTTNAGAKQLLQVPQNKAEMNNYTDKLTSVMADISLSWESIAKVSVVATYGLIQMPKDNKAHLSRLTITIKQRKQLLNKIADIFGKNLKNQIDAAGKDAPSTLVSAYMLQYFLTKKGFKAVDEK